METQEKVWVTTAHPYRASKTLFFLLFEFMVFASTAPTAWVFLSDFKLSESSLRAGVILIGVLFVIVTTERFERIAKKWSDYYTKGFVRLLLRHSGKSTFVFQGRKTCMIFVEPGDREIYIWDRVSGDKRQPGTDDPDLD